MTDVLEVVRAHVDAFNRGDLDALLEGFAEDAVFATGEHLVVGRRGLRALFGEALTELSPALELVRTVVQGDTAACELRERIEVGGVTHELPLAAFYHCRAGRLVRVKVYREGSAEPPR